MRNSKQIREMFEDWGKNLDLIVLKLEKDYYNCIDKIAKYNEDSPGYLEVDNRQRNEKTTIIDIALEYCV